MGLFQDEAYADALNFALATGMPSCSMAYAIPVQMPPVLFAPPTCHDLMNPTTTTPFTTFKLFQTTQSSSETLLQPQWIAIPLNAVIFPTYALQVQVSASQWIPSPYSLCSALWSVVKRTAELSALVLTRLLLQAAEVTPKRNPACLGDDRQPDLCDSPDLSSLLPTPAEDDLLRVDMTALEMIPPSELYLGEAELVTVVAAVPRLLSSKAKRASCPPLGSSNANPATTRGGSLSSENLTGLLQILNEELYFDCEDLGKQGATPPWPFNSPAFAAPTLLSA